MAHKPKSFPLIDAVFSAVENYPLLWNFSSRFLPHASNILYFKCFRGRPFACISNLSRTRRWKTFSLGGIIRSLRAGMFHVEHSGPFLARCFTWNITASLCCATSCSTWNKRPSLQEKLERNRLQAQEKGRWRLPPALSAPHRLRSGFDPQSQLPRIASWQRNPLLPREHRACSLGQAR